MRALFSRKIRVLFLVFIVLLIASLPEVYAGPLRERIRERIREKIEEKNLSKDSAFEGGLQAGDTKKSIFINNIKRTYVVHIPAQYRKGQSYPLVFVLHGGAGNAQNAMNMSQMNPKADKEGFIVVYPNGTGKYEDKLLHWNDGSQRTGGEQTNADDIAFFRQLISQLEKDYSVDPKKIYATGLSNGAIMSYRLGCELSDKLAAIAPVAGALNYERCIPADPLPIIVFHGTADEYVPYNGGIGKSHGGKRTDKSVSYAVNFWVKHDGCNTVPIREEFGSIVKERYSGCRANTEVVLYTIKRGGHSWPGGINGIRYGNVDPPTQEISATNLIWEFFKTHPKQ